MESFYRKNFTPFNINKLLKEKELKLQIFDYIENNVDYDEGKEFVINLFGVNEEGNSVCVVVDGFKPFFYIKSPDNKNNISDFLSRLKIFFDKGEDKGRYYVASKSLILDECKVESKKNFYGYQQKEEYFFKLVFNNSIGFHMFKKMISDLTISINNREYILEIFEGNFDPVLRFFHMRDILPSGWIKVKEFEIEDGYSNCQINVRVFWENIYSDPQNDSVAPIIQASYDIECYSDNPDVFPIPELKNNVVTHIATAFKKYGDNDFFLKHIITLKKCAPIIAKPGDPPIIVESYDTEREVLTAWSRLLVKMDPDIIYSYNGDGFDGNYIYQRSIVCGAQLNLLSFGKLKNHPGKLVSTTFSSGAYGSTDFKRLVIPGRVNFDLLIYMKREFKLSSYKLDSVSEIYLSENKNPMTPRQMFEIFESGDPEKLKEVSEYCIQDTLLPQKLIDKLNVLINQIEMSKITLVPLKFLWERGQQIKVFSQIIKRTSQKNYVIPTRTFTKTFQPDEEYDKFQGATVLEPLTGAYFDPVVTLDFQSLYPSIIRAHNFCYSTFIDPSRKLELKNVETEEIYWQEDDKEYKYLYVQDRTISVLPELLSDLFNARVAVRKKMKTESDEFTLSVLDKKQLAIKVSMNSVYGFLASQMIKCKPIAACVTAVGRQMIMKTKNYIEKNYDASCIVYGDSVSGNTPLLLKDQNGEVCIKTIETLGEKYQEYPGFKIGDQCIRNEKQFSISKYQVWTDLGWADIKKVIKHKTTKRMFRVLTHSGCVDVTEDHSLCTPDLKNVKPKDVSVGNHLLHSYPEFYKKTITFDDMKNWDNVNKEMFIKGFFFGDGSCGKYGKGGNVKYSWALNNADRKLCEKLKEMCEEIYKCEFKILETLESSGVYKIVKTGKQKDVVINYRNLFYDKDKLKTIPQEILNASFEDRLSFFKGYYAADGSKCINEKGKCIRFDNKGKIGSACLFYLCKSLGFNCSLNNSKRDIFRITCSFNNFRKQETIIKKIIELPSSDIKGDFVYDLETEVGRFQAGVGQMIVKNTDSVFVKFNLSSLPKEEQMGKAFELGKEAATKCTNNLFKTPIKLEFEKVFNPLLLFGKKMYIGQLYSSSPDKADYIDKKGVVSKRRDNAPVVRRVYDEAVNIIMTKGLLGIDELINYIKFELNNILLDKTDIKELTISKTLKSNYKSENLPHKIVAEKMFKRDPGNAPKSNDRVEYAFIENDSKKQFEKAEDPEYILKNKLKLDSIYYIEHQLQNPLTQILNLITKEPEKIFDDITSAYKLKQKRRLLIQKQDKEGQTRITSFFKSIKQDILINDDE